MHYPVPPLPQDCLAGRVILVTGANSGLGAAAALAYARFGATVALLGRNEARLEKTYDAIKAAGGPEPAMFPFDLATADDAGFERLAQTVVYHLKGLHGILHSAQSFFQLTRLEHQTLEQWQTLMRVNLVAPFALTRAGMPWMLQQPDASVVFTGESHAHDAGAYWGGFALSKEALAGLTRIWDQELELTPTVRINTLIPGPVQSPFRTRTHPGEAPEEIATAASILPWYVWLMSPQSSDIHGQIVHCQPT